jgi:hypothetical protein
MSKRVTLDWVKLIEIIVALSIGFGAVYYGQNLANSSDRGNKALEKYVLYVQAAKKYTEEMDPKENTFHTVPNKYPTNEARKAVSEEWYEKWLLDVRKTRNDFIASHLVLLSYIDSDEKKKDITRITNDIIKRNNTS